MRTSDGDDMDRASRDRDREVEGSDRGAHDGPAIAPDATEAWRRSDARIREEVTLALARDPSLDAGDVEVRVEQCEVVLLGTVADKFARAMAEDIAESVFGVTDVKNLLRVRRDRDGTEASSGRREDREVTRRPEREGGMVAGEAPRRHEGDVPASPDLSTD